MTVLKPPFPIKAPIRTLMTPISIQALTKMEINKLHLVLLAEYGLLPREEGRFRHSTKEDVEKRARQMGITLE